jgi:hypothetical protein
MEIRCVGKENLAGDGTTRTFTVAPTQPAPAGTISPSDPLDT